MNPMMIRAVRFYKILSISFMFLGMAGGLLCASLDSRVASAAAPSPEQIIAQVDSIRNPAESYKMKVEVKDVGTGDEASVYEVFLQGNTKTLLKTLAPIHDRGRNVLMQGEDMWAYIPNLKRAVRVSLSQKLTGQAANGDISRMRWSGDYAAQIQSETPKEWVLFLTARKKDLTYDKLRVWVDKATYRPTHAEFLTGAGKPLKTAQYQGYRSIAGKSRPTEILIQDAVRPSDRSMIRILEMDVEKVPASIFNQSTLGD
jgi:outer membrane lipoprotein-sorting protein